MSLVDSPPFVPDSLTDIASANEHFDRFPHYEAALEWITDFVLAPDPRLQRPGAVCPRLASTIDRNQVWLVTVATTIGRVEESVQTALMLADLFDELVTADDDFRRGALLAVFPDLAPSSAAEFIDDGHARVRPDFVRRGLMLGEFHPASSVGSVHNPTFPVMASPVPMFAVRALTPHDILFLDQPGPNREQLLGWWLDRVGGRASTAAVDHVQRALTATGR
ncbi:DUF6875 domain-containing protein [Nocardia brasiliensis]|uniref:DUF6875 domain-containing protein n=1 Tax=Nocardia brasiliensis TaxID=37326 RepID=UPI00245469DB|nr:hypothetical protein [Nocardia brasiliensis]